MGAFLLYKTSVDIDLKKAQKIFTRKGFSNPYFFEIGIYKLVLYRKLINNDINFYKDNELGIYAVGSILYNGKIGIAALKDVFIDFKNGEFNKNRLRGNFFIVLDNRGSLHYMVDPENIYNVFYDQTKSIISSSFLAVMCAVNYQLSYCKSAISEVLTTGGIIGKETLLNEVNRLCQQDIFFDGLRKIDVKPETHLMESKNYNEALEFQLNSLNEYFKAVAPVLNRYAVDMGVTGGLDSRLLILQLLKYTSNVTLYSHYRNKKNLELDIANQITNTLERPLLSPEVPHPNQMSSNEIQKQLDSAMLYMDGQIRANAFWTEPFNTASYRKRISMDSKIGMNGIGGEQYRNYERILFAKSNLAEWYYNETGGKFCGNIFYSKREFDIFINKINKKLRPYELKGKNNNYNHLSIKRFLNEVFIPSGRGLRNSIENQSVFSLSPYTDFRVSRNAYQAIPWLGFSNKFELDLLSLVDKRLNHISTTYGYTLNSGEPWNKRILTLIKELMPSNYYYSLLQKSKSRDNHFAKVIEKFPALIEGENELIKLNLPINIQLLKEIPSHSHLLISLIYFMYKYNRKIEL